MTGKYDRYWWRDDRLSGIITAPRLREYTREHVFKRDTESFFVDEYGQQSDSSSGKTLLSRSQL